MLPHIDQLHKKLTNASGVGNSCHERGLEQWPREGQQLYAVLLAHAEPYRPVDGECLQGRQRAVLELDLRASSRAEGSMSQLQYIPSPTCCSTRNAPDSSRLQASTHRTSTDTSWWRGICRKA